MYSVSKGGREPNPLGKLSITDPASAFICETGHEFAAELPSLQYTPGMDGTQPNAGSHVHVSFRCYGITFLSWCDDTSVRHDTFSTHCARERILLGNSTGSAEAKSSVDSDHPATWVGLHKRPPNKFGGFCPQKMAYYHVDCD